MPPIPIFIIVHDRVKVLKQSVESFESQIQTPIEIVFHDVASTYGPCLEYLEEMKSKGYKVYRSEVNCHLSVMNTIVTYLKQHPECDYYIITDPDVELDAVRGDILDFYVFLAQKYPGRVIGPMLRIDDLPDFYPKKQQVIESHTRQFWHKTPQPIQWNGETHYIQDALIDTTFQLVSAKNLSREFPRAGIRCYAPYAARHLDWYIDPSAMSEDQKYYSQKALPVAHWGRGINPTSLSH
jgi:glycosyltransferase involved in cell wall biosynthesis